MNIKIAHVLIILLLLPFGLRGLMPVPAIDYLLFLIPVAVVSSLLIRLHRKDTSGRIGKLAITNQMLTMDDVSQILFCQKYSNDKFGEIAVRRRFMSSSDLESLLVLQESKRLL